MMLVGFILYKIRVIILNKTSKPFTVSVLLQLISTVCIKFGDHMKSDIKPISRLTAVILCLCLCIVSSIIPASAESGKNVSVSIRVNYNQREARNMLTMINDFRTGQDAWYYTSDGDKKSCPGLNNVKYDFGLERYAMQRAAEIVLNYSHTRTDSKSTTNYFKEHKLSGAENLASGVVNAKSAIVLLKETDENYEGQSHRRAMLNSKYTRVGIAFIDMGNSGFWVQEFASGPVDSTPSNYFNGAKDVKVTVNTSLLKDTCIMTSSNIVKSMSVYSGTRKTVPDYYIGLTLKDTLEAPVPVSGKISISMKQNPYASYDSSGKQVTGIKKGTAYLNMTPAISGKTSKISVQVKNRAVQKLTKKDGKWGVYKSNGELDTSYTGLARNENGTYYVKNGRVSRDTTGIITFNSSKYYIKKGKLQSNYNGQIKSGNKTYTVKNGKVIA